MTPYSLAQMNKLSQGRKLTISLKMVPVVASTAKRN